LWSPLLAGREIGRLCLSGYMPLIPGTEVLRHHAVLFRTDGMPFCEVVEIYTAALLDFAAAEPNRWPEVPGVELQSACGIVTAVR
jgi:hypothetical protein